MIHCLIVNFVAFLIRVIMLFHYSSEKWGSQMRSSTMLDQRSLSSRERLHPSKRCQKPVHKTCTMTHREVEHVPAIRKFINSLQTIENLSQIIDGSSNSHFPFANIWFSFPRNENTTQLPRFSVWPKLTIFLCFSYFHFLAWASCVYIASKRSH